jgi:hypothetical protein
VRVGGDVGLLLLPSRSTRFRCTYRWSGESTLGASCWCGGTSTPLAGLLGEPGRAASPTDGSEAKLFPLDLKCTLSVTLADRKARAPVHQQRRSNMGAEAKRSVRELPIACGLSDLEQRKRREELWRQLFSGCQRTDELDDGYEFVFPGGPEWAEKLVRFVASERECCPFFGFEMIFESGQGPISLRVRGPEGTKDFVREEFVGG